MDIKSLTEVLRLSMMKNITSDDATSTSGMSNESTELFQLLLSEIMNNSGDAELSSGRGQLLDPDQNLISGNNEVSIDGNSSNSTNIEDAIQAAAQKYGVDDDFIRAIIKQESGFHPGAVSKAGAQGLMQLMPNTAESLGVKNPFDVLENIDGGTKYIKSLMESFNGSKELALSAYNGGIGRMNRRGVDSVEEINNMPRETQNYVMKVMKAYEGYKKG